MQVSLSEMLQRPIEIDAVRRTESGVLLRITVAVAVGAALLFGAGRTLLTTGPMTDFSDVSPEIRAGQLQ